MSSPMLRQLVVCNKHQVIFRSTILQMIVWLLVLMFFVGFIAMCGWIAWVRPSVPHQTMPLWLPGVFGIAVICPVLIYLVYTSSPFELRIDLMERTYQLRKGIFPFVFHWSGSMSDVKGLGVKTINPRSGPEQYWVYLSWNIRWRASTSLGLEKDQDVAYQLMIEAADKLRVPPSNLFGAPLAANQPQRSSEWHRKQ